jgi:hypothetical protein
MLGLTVPFLASEGTALGVQYAALVDPTPSEKAMAHHGVAKHKNEADQDD